MEQEILQPTESEQSPESPKQKVNLVAISIFLICVSILMIIGVNAGISLRKKQINVVVEKKLVPTVIKPTTIPDETANWKTYTNEKYGFEIKYPSEIERLVSFNENIFDIDSLGITDTSFITITIYQTELTPESWWILTGRKDYAWLLNTAFDKTEITNNKTGELAGIKATEVVGQRKSPGGSMVSDRVLLIAKNKLLFVINGELLGPGYDGDYDQLLSTFKFTPSLPTPSVTIVPYEIPASWQTQTNSTGLFQISYDPQKYNFNTDSDGSAQIVRKNLDNNPYYSPYGSTTNFMIRSYDNGSRHLFIEKQLKEPINSSNKLDSYKESEYLVSGKKCLIIDGISISQIPTIWGMCPISTNKALLITTFDPDFIYFFKTLKFL